MIRFATVALFLALAAAGRAFPSAFRAAVPAAAPEPLFGYAPGAAAGGLPPTTRVYAPHVPEAAPEPFLGSAPGGLPPSSHVYAAAPHPRAHQAAPAAAARVQTLGDLTACFHWRAAAASGGAVSLRCDDGADYAVGGAAWSGCRFTLAAKETGLENDVYVPAGTVVSHRLEWRAASVEICVGDEGETGSAAW